MKHILFIIIIINFFRNSKLSALNIDEELKAARSIQYATIVGFTDAEIQYEQSCFTKSVKIAGKAVLKSYKTKSGLKASGKTPSIGERCYIVADTLGFVSWFGMEKDGFIHFWAPLCSTKKCHIKHSKLFSLTKSNPEMGIDFVSAKISTTNFATNFRRNIIECGSILMQGDKVFFVPELADSCAYTIKNDLRRYRNGDKICVEGRLENNTLEIMNVIDK